MVAVTHREADKFIAADNLQIDVFLVFGSDAGLVSERISTILKKAGCDPTNPEHVLKMEGDVISADPGRLFDEAHATALFSDKRSIIVRAGARQITAAIETALSEPTADCKIIVQAGALRKDAPLRALISRARNGAAIECYPDTMQDIERLIDSQLQAFRTTMDPDARSTLAGLLGDDRLSTKAELEKLFLFAHGQQRITEKDVIDAVADASAFALETIVYAAFSGKLSILGEESSPVYASAGDAGALLALTQRHIHMLHAVRTAVDNGLSRDLAIERYGGRGVFGSRKEMLIEQIRCWQRTALIQLIEACNRVVLDSRTENRLAASITMDFLIRIAWRARALTAQHN